MKGVADRSALLEAVGLVSGVVAARTPRQQLTCVKLTAQSDGETGSLRLTGTDGEISLGITSLRGSVEQAGEVLIPADKLRQIVSAEDHEPTLTLQQADESVLITGSDARFKVMGFAPQDFPALPELTIQHLPDGYPAGVAVSAATMSELPSRALIAESIYDLFMELALKRVEAIVQGDPRAENTMIGAQASSEQKEKILSYFDIANQEGAEVLTGGGPAELEGDLAGGYYVQPTVFRGQNSMRIFQEEIFGPVVATTTFQDFDDAIGIANDTLYGLGAGVWTRNTNTAYRAGRAIEAGRVWTNCYHLYPAHAAFGGYKHSGIGRENHKMMLNHYQQTKNLLVSYDEKPMGFF